MKKSKTSIYEMLVVVNNNVHDDVMQTQATRKLLAFLTQLDEPFRLVSSVRDLRDIIGDSGVSGIILSGSDLRLTEPLCPEKIAVTNTLLSNCRVPVLGICFGHQLLALLGGGALSRLPQPRQGMARVGPVLSNPVVEEGTYMQNHKDYVTKVPFGWIPLAQTGDVVEIMCHKSKPWIGVQFHPELSGFDGRRVLWNFLQLCWE